VRESVTPILERAGARVVSVNGLALANYVREHYPHIGVLLATGYSEDSFRVPGVVLVTKPYQAQDALELMARFV
jgi:hypothetical protein